MRSLTDALPCQERGAYLSKSIRNKLIDSLDYLLEVNKNILPGEYYNKVKNILETIYITKKLPGIYYAFNSFLLQATCSGEMDCLGKYISALSLITPKAEISYSSFAEDKKNEGKNELLRKYMLFDLMSETDIFAPTPEAARTMEVLVKETLELINNIEPIFYQEMLEFVSEFMFFESSGIKAGSSFDLFGMIYISAVNHRSSIVNMADVIIHEAAHLYLYAIGVEDPLVLNEYEEKHFSPIRGQARSLIGIYHAMFVLARVIYFLRQLKKSAFLLLSDREETEVLLDRYQNMAIESLRTVQTHAKLTDLGASLLKSTADLIAVNPF